MKQQAPGASAPVRALTPHSLTKVFGIGFHKTMTTSLARALYTLGYHVGGAFSTGQFTTEEEITEHVMRMATDFDAVQDVPWPVFYDLLDQQFESSKFILTVRDTDRWWSSVETHFGTRRIPTHEYIYGVPTAEGHEQTYRDRYEAHNRDVESYFSDRPDDLLVMDMADGDGWPELCGFLGLPVPPFEFPHQNPAGGRRRGRVRRKTRREIEKLARKVGVPDSTLQGERLRAVPFWAAVHDLTSHTGALVSAVDELDSDRERMRGMVRAMIEVYPQWAEQFEIPVHESVRRLLEEWDLAAAWTVLCPTIRHWAGGLLDDGFGVYCVGSSDAVPAARALVNNGVDSYVRVAGALPVASRSSTKLAHI